MRFRYITNEGPFDVRECPNPDCEEGIKLLPGQDVVECEACEKKWRVSVDADFYDNMWHDLTTATEIT